MFYGFAHFKTQQVKNKKGCVKKVHIYILYNDHVS